MTPATLPTLMVAPNGARKGKQDHPALPITIAEIVETAISCHAAGAGGIHAHVRDAEGGHVLDAGLYKELIVELGNAVPEMMVQITTEAVGIYSPDEQMQLVRDIMPKCVSISARELHSADNAKTCPEFYEWANDVGIAVQHILYSVDDLELLSQTFSKTSISPDGLQILFVLGRYTSNQESEPQQLDSFLAWANENGWKADWAVCAFGRRETDCLAYAIANGGKVRVGFENSFWNSNGSVAANNAERVREIKALTA